MGRALDPRQEAILAAVVEAYVEQAAPVGSKTVVRKGVALSPATVRSEMCKLDSLGLLDQPHASAGRQPSDSGFRYYVEHLMDMAGLLPEDRSELEGFWDHQWSSSEDVVSKLASLLSSISRNVGLVMLIPTERAPLTSVRFVKSSQDRILAVINLSDGGREERIIRNQWKLETKGLQKLAALVNRVAPGRTLTGLRRELIRQMEEAKTQANLFLARAVELSEQLIIAREPELSVRGQANLIDSPEFAEMGRVREMVTTLEEKSLLVEMLEEISLASGVRVVIGNENKIEFMKQCTVIASTYGRGDTTVGALGVIGPTRMDYARLIPLVYHASGLASERLSRQ